VRGLVWSGLLYAITHPVPVDNSGRRTCTRRWCHIAWGTERTQHDSEYIVAAIWHTMLVQLRPLVAQDNYWERDNVTTTGAVFNRRACRMLITSRGSSKNSARAPDDSVFPSCNVTRPAGRPQRYDANCFFSFCVKSTTRQACTGRGFLQLTTVNHSILPARACMTVMMMMMYGAGSCHDVRYSVQRW